MKTSLLLLLITGCLLFSCSPKQSNETNRVVVHAATTKLTLNGQERWQTDNATSNSMLLLQDLMHEYAFYKENHTTEAYNSLGQVMEEELQHVFRNCTMEGEAHDMLHAYLKPLAEDVMVLKGENVSAATAAYKPLDARIKQYYTYFK